MSFMEYKYLQAAGKLLILSSLLHFFLFNIFSRVSAFMPGGVVLSVLYQILIYSGIAAGYLTVALLVVFMIHGWFVKKNLSHPGLWLS